MRRFASLRLAWIGFSILVVIFLLAPIITAVIHLLRPESGGTLALIVRTIELPGLATTLWNTFVVIAVGGLCALLIGSAIAWLNERTDAQLGWFSDVFPILPLLVPPVAAAIGWVFLLSPTAGNLNILLRWIFNLQTSTGPLDIFTWTGLIFLYTVELVPLVFLVMVPAFRTLDSRLEEAARTFGASPFRAFLNVTLPAIRPALASASWLILTIGIVIFSVPAVVGKTAKIDVLSTRIVDLITSIYPPQIEVAIVLGALMLLVVLGGWVIQAIALKGGHFSKIEGRGSASTRIPLGRGRVWARVLMILFAAAGTVIPVCGLIFVSLQSFWTSHVTLASFNAHAYLAIFSNTDSQLNGFSNSAMLGAIAATFTLAISSGFAIVRILAPSRSGELADALLKVPAVFSHIVIAIGVLLLFGGAPFRLTGTLLILLIAYIIIYMPQASIATGAAFQRIDKSLLEAGQIYGARPRKVITSIVIPLTRAALVNGWLLVFVYVAGDLTASFLLAGTSIPTVGYLLLTLYNNGTYPEIAAFGVVATSMASAIVIFGLWIAKRGDFRNA